MKATTGLQSDIGVFLADQGNFPTASDLVSGQPIFDAAAELEGKYFGASGVTVAATTGMITVTFDDGANSGNTVTLTPNQNAAGGQIASWTCAPGTTNGIDAKRLPSSCQ
ncbi:pilin [Suttonella sp. R2A3]|nr:pilin [Suttonella sp. R2A3]